MGALTLYRLIYLSVIRELKKGLRIHANTSGSDSPTDPKRMGSFLVTECRFQDTRGCSEIVCRQASSGEKVEATRLLFSVKHQKGKDTPTSWNRLHRNLAYFRQRRPTRCRPDHAQRSQVFKKSEKMTKSDLFKKWEKIKISVPFWRRLYRFCWGGGAKTDPIFLRKNMFYHPVSVHHRGWVGLAVGCTQRTTGIYVSHLQQWLVKG